MHTSPEREFLPNLFLLGVAKCGTTTLHAYLDQMPDVCMAHPKEPRFFDFEFEKGPGFYRSKYFAHWRGEKIIGDAQTRNIYLPFVPARIHGFNPDAKLLVLLRDPVERAHSDWFHFVSRGREPLTFEKAIENEIAGVERTAGRGDEQTIWNWLKWARGEMPAGTTGAPQFRNYLETGYYCEQIQRYLALFPRENLKVILFEEMVAKPKEIVNDVCRFLGLDETINQWREPVWRNPATPNGRLPNEMRIRQSWVVRKTLRVLGMKHKIKEEPAPAHMIHSSRPPIEPATRAMLTEHYREHNARLAEFLGRDLSSWWGDNQSSQKEAVVGSSIQSRAS